jgi:predicted SAM-dependent methyltransferase
LDRLEKALIKVERLQGTPQAQSESEQLRAIARDLTRNFSRRRFILPKRELTENFMQTLKQFIKHCGFIVGLVRALRAGVLDVKQLYWKAIRGGKIRAYFVAHSSPKLHIGASGSLLSGWLNTDFILESSGVVYLDATQRFPLPDDAFDYVISEHMIEHIDYAGGQSMLSECFRVLKPGGRIRLTTPDLQVLARLCAPHLDPMQTTYVNFITDQLFPEIKTNRGVFAINVGFRAWGHQFIYDPQTLSGAMAGQGFEDFKIYKPGISDDPNLRGLETHGKVINSEDINQFESFVVEARVPMVKKQPVQ